MVSTPVLRGLRARFPDSTIGFIGSEVTADFERAFGAINWRCSWDDSRPSSGLLLQQTLLEKRERYGPVQLALNLDGFNPLTCSLVPFLEPNYVAGGSLTSNRRRRLPWGDHPRQKFLADADWDSTVFMQRYDDVFSSNYISELFCQLAWVHDYVDSTSIELPSVEPPFPVPDVLIHCTTARSAKIWPFIHWRELLNYFDSRKLSVGLVGSPPAAQKESYNAGVGEESLLDSTFLIDLRGQTSLMQLAGACRIAKAVISVDAGPLHIAAAVGTPTYALVGNDVDGVGASPVRLWMPRCGNVTRSITSESCSICADNRFQNDDCLVEGHPCMEGIQPSEVIKWLDTQFC